MSEFNISIGRKDSYWKGADIPAGFRQTSYIGPIYEDILSESNYAVALERLRALDGVVEGEAGSDLVNWEFIDRERGDWYEDGGFIIWKCNVTPEELRLARQRGYYRDDRQSFDNSYSDVWHGYQNIALDLLGRSNFENEEPLLDELIDMEKSLAGYPVLDDEDFSEREYEAEKESIICCAPPGVALTDEQAGEIHHYLYQDSWPSPARNEQGCPAEYQVEWNGNDYHVNGRENCLDDCVRHACFILGYIPMNKHGEYLPRRIGPRRYGRRGQGVWSWRGERLGYNTFAKIIKRYGMDELIRVRNSVKGATA
jgi:hypothetical protein